MHQDSDLEYLFVAAIMIKDIIETGYIAIIMAIIKVIIKVIIVAGVTAFGTTIIITVIG